MYKQGFALTNNGLYAAKSNQTTPNQTLSLNKENETNQTNMVLRADV